jgi:hypothetical protein
MLSPLKYALPWSSIPQDYRGIIFIGLIFRILNRGRTEQDD